MITALRIGGREVRPHKASVTPLWDARNVLTNSPWEFVSLWLSRNGHSTALFLWDQARTFAEAARGMGPGSAPLLHYYSFLNAAKALLEAKGLPYNHHHGVRGYNMRGSSNRISLSNEGVEVLARGVFPSLAGYLGDTETSNVHTLQELFFNLPFIHRTYCLTYRSQTDLFLPLVDCSYVYDESVGEGYLQAQLSKDYLHHNYLRTLPPSFIADPEGHEPGVIRSVASVAITSARLTRPSDVNAITDLHRELRRDLRYINAPETLWYLRRVVSGPRTLACSPLTLTFAAMHRLSELCRYRPIELDTFLSGRRNWLLSEFVELAPGQFLDEIASELTGYQFLLPNVRSPT